MKLIMSILLFTKMKLLNQELEYRFPIGTLGNDIQEAVRNDRTGHSLLALTWTSWPGFLMLEKKARDRKLR
tara:strand:+ start:242 stop:454 length:213 start_codon:yes stop_codon:yes gene_type:complete